MRNKYLIKSQYIVYLNLSIKDISILFWRDSNGIDFGVYGAPGLPVYGDQARGHRAGCDFRHRPYGVYFYFSLQTGLSAYRCHADHPGGGDLRRFPADLRRPYGDAEGGGTVPADQSETHYHPGAGDHLVPYGSLRHGPRGIYHVPHYL